MTPAHQEAEQQVVRVALERGFLDVGRLREALLLQGELARRGQPAELLGILQARFLHPQHLLLLRQEWSQALNRSQTRRLPSPSQTPTVIGVELPPALALPEETIAIGQARAALPSSDDPRWVQETLCALRGDETQAPPERGLGRYRNPAASSRSSGYGSSHSSASSHSSGAAPRPGEAARAPRQLGPYTLERELGRGGAGVVYEAIHRDLEQRVALKLLEQGPQSSQTEAARFLREAKAIGRLKHEAIVGVHQFGEEGGWLYLAMQLLPGPTLKQLVKDDGPFEQDEACRLGEKLARGLAYAHSQGVLHRDIKPHNVLLDREGNPVLTDFGLAKIASELSLTRSGQTIGTAAYMSPEQAAGERSKVDARSDIYSLGMTLYQLLAGKPAFQGKTQINILSAVLTKPAPPLSSVRADVDPQLEEVIMRCLEKDPDQRYATALELADELSDLRLRLSDPEAGRAAGGGVGLLTTLAAALLVLGGAVAGGLIVMGNDGERAPASPSPRGSAPASSPSPPALDVASELERLGGLIRRADRAAVESPFAQVQARESLRSAGAALDELQRQAPTADVGPLRRRLSELRQGLGVGLEGQAWWGPYAELAAAQAHQQALALLERRVMVAGNPEQGAVYALAAYHCDRLGQFREAVNYLERVRQLNDLPPLQRLETDLRLDELLTLFARFGSPGAKLPPNPKLQARITAYRQGMYGGHWAAHVQPLLAASYADDWTTAEQRAGRLSELDPEAPEVLTALAIYRYERAKGPQQQLAELGRLPFQERPAWHQEQVRLGLVAARRAVEVAPDDPRCWDALGLLLKLKRELEEARQAYRQAWTLFRTAERWERQALDEVAAAVTGPGLTPVTADLLHRVLAANRRNHFAQALVKRSYLRPPRRRPVPGHVKSISEMFRGDGLHSPFAAELIAQPALQIVLQLGGTVNLARAEGSPFRLGIARLAAFCLDVEAFGPRRGAALAESFLLRAACLGLLGAQEEAETWLTKAAALRVPTKVPPTAVGKFLRKLPPPR